MSRTILAGAAITCIAAALTATAPAQQPPAPTFATTKVEGTDSVYVFRYGFDQSMFVVTPDGVIATDPIGYLRPLAVKTYIEEIRKVTDKPIKYVIYSHHHYDHIAGGKPFKDLGATFIAHQRAKQHLEETKNPDVVIPDLVVDDNGGTVELGGTTLKLVFVGRSHSDNSLVMFLPKEKLIFAVDTIRIRSVQFRNMPDTFPLEFEESIKKTLALDWDRMIPGHPGPGGRLGTKDDARDVLGYLQDVSAATKKAAEEGKCFDAAMKEVKLTKYESWANYAQYFPGNVERYCMLWGRGS